MSKGPKTKSDEVLAPPESHSVYDFLYHDARRIGSYLAQFEASGLLQSVKQTIATEESEQSEAGATAGASLLRLASASGQFKDQAGSVSRQGIEKQYDPFWTHAISLLTLLEQRGMIGRSLSAANIGQFVLVSGSLLVLDMPALKSAWAVPGVQKLLKAGMAQQGQPALNREQRRAQGHQGKERQISDELELAISFLSFMPHILQCRVIGNGVDVWCSLDEDSVVGKASDLTLKHGTLVQGTWSVLGVLDAYPDPTAVLNAGLADAVNAVVATPLGQISARFAPAARLLLGRPEHAFGLTPLLIFRQLGGEGEGHSPEQG